MSNILAQAEELIPAEVRMISGCMDSQTSADVSNVANFQLPDPAGKAGGACTSALLNVLYKDHKRTDVEYTFQEVLLKMRGLLKGRYTQIPQLSASRPLDIKTPFHILPDNFSGKRRAVLIGINYIGQQGELSGCHNDVKNIKEYIMDVHGFEESDIVVLMDDGYHESPTKSNIINAYRKVVAESVEGDAVFCHYSGHGGKVRDDDGDEADGYDETLIPVDYQRAGQIRDDDVFSTLVGPMRRGVTLTCIMDCCHSGSILDLPYVFKADGESDEMSTPEGFDFKILIGLAAAMAANGGKIDPMLIASTCCKMM